MILIDGSYLEGGGQILRTAIALSAITGKPCRVSNIRRGRDKPGLQPQHLKGIEAAAKLCGAELKNARIGSTDVEFVPGKIAGGNFTIDTGTAGSITLVLQTLIPICLFAESETKLEVIGGTDVLWSPNTTYFQHIFCDYLRKMGIEIKIDTLRYGFYPKGGGVAKATINPCKEPMPLDLLERGSLQKFDVWSVSSESLRKANVSERQINGVKHIIDKKLDKTNTLYVDSLSPGSSVHVHAHFDNCKIGATILGEVGKMSEKVGEECARLLKKQLDTIACADEWMADQILPYMALAGESKVSVAEVTDHCKTNIWVIEKFLPVKFRIDGNVISCATLR